MAESRLRPVGLRRPGEGIRYIDCSPAWANRFESLQLILCRFKKMAESRLRPPNISAHRTAKRAYLIRVVYWRQSNRLPGAGGTRTGGLALFSKGVMDKT